MVRTREDSRNVRMKDVELSDWTTAVASGGQVRPATLYTATDYPSVSPDVGDDVLTHFGRGRVVEIRVKSNCLVVLLSSWRLAGRSRVTCYLSLRQKDLKNETSHVQVVRHKKLYEMSVYEKVEQALVHKEKAGKLFAVKDYAAALDTYSRAVDAVKYVQHQSDSSNHVRADLLVVMITCSNNAATCCTQLGQWDRVNIFSTSAINLINALEAKKGMRIHSILTNEDGYTDAKLFGEWHVKSSLMTARALSEQGEDEKALQILKTAHERIQTHVSNDSTPEASRRSLLAMEKEVRKLHVSCKEHKKSQRKKEKARAQAMFSKSNNEKQDEANTVSSRNGITIAVEGKQMAKGDDTLINYRTLNNAPPPDDDIDKKTPEVPWYADSEVLAGLAVVGAALAGVAILLIRANRK